MRTRSNTQSRLDADYVAEFFDSRGTFHQGGVLFVIELDLDDLFQASRASLHNTPMK